jgi:hypothetical protein
MTTPETLTPDEADKLMTSGDGCCMFCEVDLNLGRGHGDWCKWPVIRAAWEADLNLAGDCLEAAEEKLRGCHLVNKSLRTRLEAAREGWDLCLAELKRRDKRLEAAERYHDRYAQYIRSFVGKDHDADACDAALAGEKP